MKHTAQLVLMVAALTTEIGAATADASMITWQWTGIVTGHTGAPAGLTLDTVVPLGTRIDVSMSLDPDAAYLNAASCLQGRATASFQVLGKTYTNGGFVWEDARGFGPGTCAPSENNVEIVVPSWGSGGPALADGWVPFRKDDFLPGVWWSGDLATGQPASISSQFPYFYSPGQSIPQRFTASMQAVTNAQPTPVPEPSTWLLMSTGLSACAAWRRRRH